MFPLEDQEYDQGQILISLQRGYKSSKDLVEEDRMQHLFTPAREAVGQPVTFVFSYATQCEYTGIGEVGRQIDSCQCEVPCN